MFLFAVIVLKMASNGGARLDELTSQLSQTVNDICELEREKMRLRGQRASVMGDCEVLRLEVAELDNMIENVRSMHSSAKAKNEELKRELEQLRSRL